MPQEADIYIAENRRDIRATASNFIQAAERQNISISFARNLIEVSVGITVYKRSLGDTFIIGHPDDSQGIGEGDLGDNRESWTQVEDTIGTAEFTKAGRNALRDALDGQAGGIDEAGVGTDSTTASTGDTSLGSLSTKTNATSVDSEKPNSTTARGIGVWRFADHENEAVEFGLYNTDGSLLCRLTLPSSVSPTSGEELKAEIDLTVSGDGTGTSVVTDDGEEAVADALHDKNTTVGLNKIAIGTGTTDFSKSDSSLTSEEDRKPVTRDLLIEAIRASATWFDGEPSGLPTTFSEMAIYDNAGTPRMIWATTFSGEEKTDGVPLQATVGFRIA